MRVWLLAALMTTVAMAGCLSDEGDDEGMNGEESSANPAGIGIGTWAIISDSESGPEPSIGVAPTGELFTILSPLVYRSTDDGNTWENLGDPLEGLPNNDPDLAVDTDGTVWESRLYGTACNEVSVSQDLGDTWASNVAVCAGGGGDRQYVIPTQSGEAYLYWHDVPSLKQTAMKTTDYGATWLPLGIAESSTQAAFATGNSGWGGGGFWNQQTGSVFFTYSWNGGIQDNENLGSGPAYSITRDGGETFETVVAASYTQGSQTLGLALVTGAADDAGNIYLTWGESFDGDVAVFVVGSQDDGETWTEPVRVDAATTGKVFPVVMAGADGHIAVAYYEAYEQAFPDDVEGNWTVSMSWTGDFFAANPTFSKMGMSEMDVKTGPICISGTTCSANTPSNREFADYFDGVRLADGRVGLTYNLLTDGTGAMRNVYAATDADILGANPA
jgi:hypothetical protein